MALREYYDGSVSVAPKPHTTLTCLAADESVWRDLEPAWEDVRKCNGNPAYIHMTDLMSLGGIYKGWSVSQRDQLVDAALGVLLGLGDNRRLRACTATVDMAAHERVGHIRALPSPERMCARVIFPTIFQWYSDFPDTILDFVDVFFDSGEPFLRHITQDWTSRKFKQRFPMWHLIRTVAPVQMRYTPPIQMADVICWGWQRIASSSNIATDPLGEYAVRASHCVTGIIRPIDEEALLKMNWKEEGSLQQHLQKTKEEALMPRNPSPEFKKFDAMMKRIMRVQHDELRAALDAEKREKDTKRKPKTSASGRELREQD